MKIYKLDVSKLETIEDVRVILGLLNIGFTDPETEDLGDETNEILDTYMVEQSFVQSN